MHPDLIFDVGLHNGDDTAHYLRQGYRVVAIDADPTLIEEARTQFANAIAARRLELVNVAIGPRRETAEFWICQTHSAWNSFDRSIASRDGHTPRGIEVPCLPFRDLLERYGVPFYLKIDIEGHDRYCIQALTAPDLPDYVSFELDTPDHTLASLRHLDSLGYTGFKLITQNTHTALETDPRLVDRLRHAMLPRLQRLHLAERFPFGSSGPFGERTDGRWRTVDDVLAIATWFREGRSPLGEPGLNYWHDVHARLGSESHRR